VDIVFFLPQIFDFGWTFFLPTTDENLKWILSKKIQVRFLARKKNSAKNS